MAVLGLDELLALADAPTLDHEGLLATGGGWALVELPAGAGALDPTEIDRLHALPIVLIGLGTGPLVDAIDVAVDDDSAVDALIAAVDANPMAATALALLLRGGDRRTVAQGLIAESSTYSTLQAGAEHRAWLADHVRRDRPAPSTPPVRVERDGDRLLLTLARPEVRNAFDAATRDALLEGLSVASADPSITDVVLAGDGPSFCSGGDLDEFGTATDPAAAHLLRLARSVAGALHAVAPRVTADVHGACIGAGIELPAFAGRVVARDDTTFALPEVGMGLVPGAGGTVSITRRIGRHRTMWLALTGQSIDAATALDWGLVDDVVADWA